MKRGVGSGQINEQQHDKIADHLSGPRTPYGSSELGWAQKMYRRVAPLYGGFRTIWSRWTRSAEEELDRLFAERIGPQTRILELAPGTGINVERLLRCAPGFQSYLGIDITEAEIPCHWLF